MKKKIIIVLLSFLMLLTTGCGQSNIEFQSKIIKNNYSYNIEKYPTIKKIAYEYELALLDRKININSICFEEATYVNGKYKTVVFSFNKVNATLKFDKNQNLMLISIMKHGDENTYSDIKNATLFWDYFGLSFDQVMDVNFFSDNGEKEIGNFEYKQSILGYVITDKRYSKN